ncbi:MAG: hypothetical protein HUJ72_03420 [Blautia sp.]|nr:hypothetical protein [Blautia sp.]
MKGNPRKPEYFKWFSLAVDMGLRLTRQYEYYIETMDVSYRRELPKSLLLYFSYNSDTLSDAKRAYIYASVIADKGHSLQNYEKYRENMLAFARRTLRDGRMNEDYAILYQEFWRELQDEEEQKSLASCIFANRLFCDDRKIRYVVVRHAQLRKEEIYQCVHGTAYPRIYTDDAVIMFQDEKQRRYVQTVDYNLAKLMDEQPVAEELIRQGQEEAGLLLHYAEHHEISAENLPVFLKTADSETFTEAYRNSIRKRILDYYVQNETGESLEKTLKGMNHRAYAEVDRTEMLTVLIAAGMYPEALEVMKSQGVEGMDDTRLLKTVSRLIQDTEGERDDDLISLASEIHRRGVYNETLLNYLMLWRYAPMDEMLQIWKNAGGFELDTYAFEERILGLLMLCSDYRKDGEMILASYIGHSGKRQTIGAYLTQAAYGIFVKEYAISGFLTEMLLRVYEEEWPVDRVCHLALFKAISKEKDSKGKYTQLKEDLLKECMEDEMLFAFYRKLPQSILSPYQLDDKTFVECHASPAAKVTIRYALDNGFNKDVKYHTEPMQATYEGIFVKTFTLFYGESLRYSFVIEEKDKTRKTSERVITMNKVDGEANSKYHMLNQMLMARHLDKNNEVASRLQKYIHQENFVKEVFTIEGEE